MKLRGRDARRLLHHAAVLLRHGLAFAAIRVLRRLPLAGRRAPHAVDGAVRFRRLLEDLGGSFIKFGQMLALQPDIVSLEYANELFDLLDRVAPVPLADVEQVVREELGRPPSELFDRFDPVPLAAASIGQVHRATLGGRQMAVKVQRPDAEAQFTSDVRIMLAVVRLVQRFHIASLYWLIEPTTEFAAWTGEELDYRREARYLARLGRTARTNAFARIPQVVTGLTTRRVLTMEFLSGVTVLDYLRARANGEAAAAAAVRGLDFDRVRFARHIIDNFLGDAFRHGIFHADLHPGNLMILPENVVGYVDFGITGVLSGYARQHLMHMTLAYTRGDIDGIAAAFGRLAIAEPGADIAAFHDGLRRLAPQWYATEETGRRLRKNFTLVMLDMLLLSRASGIWPERDVIKYIRSSIAADGLITRFAPGFDLGAYLEEVCDRWTTQVARERALSVDRAAEVIGSTVRLMGDGAERAASVLARLADGNLSADVQLTVPADRDHKLRRRTMRLAGVVLVLGAIVGTTGSPRPAGLNIFTVELFLTSTALIMLSRSIVQLLRVKTP